MKTITSQSIGTLRQSKEFNDWWESEPIAIPFFDGLPLSITFMDLQPAQDSAFIKEADEALVQFLAMDSAARLELSDLVHQNCMEFLQAIGYDEEDKPLWDIKDKHDIWKFVRPEEIHLARRQRRDKDVYLMIACECDWEQEHGLQLVFRRGQQLTRISEQDGWLTTADAYDTPDEADELLRDFQQ